MDSATEVSRGEDVVTAVCALRQRRRQFDPQAFLLLRSADRRTEQHAGPLPGGGSIGHVMETRVARSACAAASLKKGDRQGTPCPTKRDGQATAVCSQESSTAMARPTRVMTRTCAWQVGGWWRTRAPDSPSRSLEALRAFHVLAHCARACPVCHGQQLC